MGNKILFIVALHGDEGFGVDVLRRIEHKFPKIKYNYDWIVGNTEAYKLNERFTQADLNRVAPGSAVSKIYEERRAFQLREISENYAYVVDIHGTNANSGIFTLVTNPTIDNLVLSSLLPIKKVVIWASQKSKQSGPVTQHMKCPAVEIECGPKTSKKVQDQLYKILSTLLKNTMIQTFDLLSKSRDKKFFYVYGTAKKINTSKMKEFRTTEINGEKFYPLLINSYKRGSARKMKKLELFDLLALQ